MKRILVLLFFVSSVGYSQTLTQQNDSLIRRQIFNPIRHAQMFKAVIDSLDVALSSGNGVVIAGDSVSLGALTNDIDISAEIDGNTIQIGGKSFLSGLSENIYIGGYKTITPLFSGELDSSGDSEVNIFGGNIGSGGGGSISLTTIGKGVYITGASSQDSIIIKNFGGNAQLKSWANTLQLQATNFSISSNGSLGTSGQVFTSNGTTATWQTPSSGFANPMTTTGDIIQSTSGTTAGRLASVATGNVLLSGGVATVNSWGKVGLSTHVSGTLPVANGGTGITSFGTGVATALGNNTNSTGGLATYNAELIDRIIPSSTTGTVIDFTSLKVFGTVASPETGNITDNLTSAYSSLIQKVYHNNSSEPTYPAGWVNVGGTYTNSTLNIIYCEWVSGTRVEYWITQ